MGTETTPDPSHEDPVVRDLTRLARLARGKKPAWSHRGEDLSLNLISCIAGEGVGHHVNTEVEVLMIGVDGVGSVELHGRWHRLGSGQVIVIPKGARRATRCDGDHFTYLTCHINRAGLWPSVHGPAIEQGGRS